MISDLVRFYIPPNLKLVLNPYERGSNVVQPQEQRLGRHIAKKRFLQTSRATSSL